MYIFVDLNDQIPQVIATLSALATKQSAMADSLNRIEAALASIAATQEKMMLSQQDIIDRVDAMTTVEEGVVALLDKLAADLKAAIASNDPVGLQHIADTLDAQKKAFADAIARNTPADPASDTPPNPEVGPAT